jgi:Ca2+-binding EF-hand superfamily protein
MAVSGPGSTEEELDAIMGQVDADGNGEVELSEFMDWWK